MKEAFLRYVPFLLFVAVFSVYAFCAYPTIAPRDSADLAAAALTLGVAHPPGYPLYAVLGKAWLAAFPMGNPAYRLNLLSGVCGAAAVAAVYVLIFRRAGVLAALGAALGLAFSAPLWKFSLLEEMYSLHALFIALLLLLSWGERSSLLRRAALSALVFGLGFVNHQSLVLLGPALVLLWHRELRRHQFTWGRVLAPAAVFLLLGLSLEAVVWIRLGDARLAWAVLTRAEYGTLELFRGFSRGLSPALASKLLGHLASGLWAGCGGGLVLLALLGAVEAGQRQRDLGIGIALALAFFGLFFLMTRLDLSEWVARSVLEPAFIAPTLALSVLAGLGISRLEVLSPALGLAAALAAALLPLWLHGPQMVHRDDFSAYDYARDLRRSLPPGSAAIIRGDTALFALRYLELLDPLPSGRVLISSLEPNLRARIQSEMAARPVYVSGLPLEELEGLGLLGLPYYVLPAGLVQRVSKGPLGDPDQPSWELSILRRSRSMERGESYAHDIRLSYAFAHYLSGQLRERSGSGDPAYHYQMAALLDPEDYRVERVPVR